MVSKLVKVAAVQAAPVAFDLERSLERVAKFTAEAARSGADLVVFPYVAALERNSMSSWLINIAAKAFSQHILGVMHSTLRLAPENHEVSTVQRRVCTLLKWTGRKWYAKYYNSAISLSSPEFGNLRSIAEQNSVFLSVGIIEKDGATLYCTAVLIDRGGELLSAHRKV